MKQTAFEQHNRPHWERFSEQLLSLEQRKAKAADTASFTQDYRRLCQHLALARQRGYSSHLVDNLQHLAMRGHHQLYRRRGQIMAHLAAFILADFPRQVRQHWPFVLTAALLFMGSLLLTGCLVYQFPDLIYAIVDPDQVRAMENMYDPDRSRLGPASERLAGDDWMMFGYYIMNNIGIAFQTFASGLLLGLGSLFFLLFNGLSIGAVAGHLSEIGYRQTFFSFVIGHGAFELTAIVLAGAAGLRLGWALLTPGPLSRGEALKHAARASLQLVYGVLLMLVIAAFIEAYWSARTSVSSTVKYVVGAVLWLLVLSYLTLAGRQVRHAPV